MASWTGLIGAGLRTIIARRIKRLGDDRWWAANARRLQCDQLRGLLRKAANTEVGRENDFARIAALDDDAIVDAYRKALPVATYDDLKDRLERMRVGGERDICWPGLVRDWAQTSGTTAGDKYVPVSKELLAHNRKASFDIFAHATRFGVSVPRLFAGRLLFLGGSTNLVENEHGVRTGDLSGVVTQLITWPLSEVYLPGREIALMEDWPAKMEAMAEACLDRDVRMISGMASWSLVLFERVVEMARSRGRAGATLRDIWPNLTLFIHGGVRYDPFAPAVREAWSGSADGPDVPHRLEVYPASEGFVAMQDRPGDRGLRLNIDHGVFYDFVPIEQIHDDAPEAFTCDAVEPGQRYVVVMSTPAGLWRYVLGDVVEFDSIPRPDGSGGPPRLRIVGRHRLFVNAFGENLIVEHIENAVIAASEKTGVRVGEFTAAPVYPTPTSRSGLELVVEWEGSIDAIDAFAQAFDASLKAQNNDYTAKRTGDMGMDVPTITPLASGAFHEWMRATGKLGGQHKCPRCANHRDFLEGVLSTAVATGLVKSPTSTSGSA